MKYFIITFGCQMNLSDSERITAVLENVGYERSSKINEADLIVINMCSVRQSAVNRVYGLIPKFKKLKTKNNKLKILLTGCILKKDKRKFIKEFDLILNIKELPKLPNFLNSKSHPPTSKTDHYLKINPAHSNNFSAQIPIMNGCNNFCTYCVVPYTRGREISRPAEEILCEIRNLIKRNFKEIWLLGQNVNSYCSNQKPETNNEQINFAKLLRTVNDIKGNFWIRFTSSHPKDFSDELINIMAGREKVTEYLNLPVQSGDNEILKKMNRPYTIEEYKNLIKKIREKIPEISLSTDVIVGFPGETKKQFQNTLSLFKEIKYDMAYIARYSPRSSTAAEKLKDDVSTKEKERRWKVLTKILKETALKKNKKYSGKTVEVLVMKHETCNMKHFYIGKTRTYKTIKFQVSSPKFQDLVGQFAKVKIIDALPWGLKGVLV